MNIDFYNGKYTVIASKDLKIDFGENIHTYYGDIKQQALNIKQYELDNDEFYSGHVVVNSITKLRKLIKEKRSLVPITRNILDNRSCYFDSITHSGVDSECSVNKDIIFCSSWVLPIIAENKRTGNSLYGDLFVHRITMKEFENKLI